MNLLHAYLDDTLEAAERARCAKQDDAEREERQTVLLPAARSELTHEFLSALRTDVKRSIPTDAEEKPARDVIGDQILYGFALEQLLQIAVAAEASADPALSRMAAAWIAERAEDYASDYAEVLVDCPEWRAGVLEAME